MKMVIAIVSNDDTNALVSKLIKNNFKVTKLATTGGFLKAGNSTLLIGCEEEKVDAVLGVIKEEAQQRDIIVPISASYDAGRYMSFPTEVKVGGATVFVIDVDRFVRL